MIDDKYDILLAEQDPAAIRVLQSGLGPVASRIDSTGTAEEAYRKLNNNEYDVIIADLRLPGARIDDFISQAGRIRPAVEIIVTAESSDIDELRKLMSITGAGGLVKPFQMNELVKSVQSIIQRPKIIKLEIRKQDIPNLIKILKKKFPDISIR